MSILAIIISLSACVVVYDLQDTVSFVFLFNCVGASFLAISAPYTELGSGFVVPSATAKAGVEAMSRYVYSVQILRSNLGLHAYSTVSVIIVCDYWGEVYI